LGSPEHSSLLGAFSFFAVRLAFILGNVVRDFLRQTPKPPTLAFLSFRFFLLVFDATSRAEQMLDPFALCILAGCIAILVLGIATEDFS
jgi:hypothetical protein